MNKHLKYLRYVLVHKWFVFLYCCRFGIPWRGIKHDLSKFRPSEWFGMVEYYYTDRRQTDWFTLTAKYGIWEAAPWGADVDDMYKIACKRHFNRNDHHWEHWASLDGKRPFSVGMPLAARKEMIADWLSFARTRNSDPWAEYEKRKANIILRPEDREWVEEQLQQYRKNEPEKLAS